MLAEDIKVDDARAELEEAQGLVGQDDDAEQRVRRAESRIRAVEKAS